MQPGKTLAEPVAPNPKKQAVTQHEFGIFARLLLCVRRMGYYGWLARRHPLARRGVQHAFEPPAMPPLRHQIQLRVRYADTDQMGTYYNARVFEWFECARNELLRAAGKTYREMERHGIRLPVSEAHAEYQGKAQYDDLLTLAATLTMPGKARFRFDVEIRQSTTGELVCRGYTVHVVADAQGKPMRPPRWITELFAADERGDGESGAEEST